MDLGSILAYEAMAPAVDGVGDLPPTVSAVI